MIQPDFLYVGSPFEYKDHIFAPHFKIPEQDKFSSINNPIFHTHTCAVPKIAVAALMALDLKKHGAYLELKDRKYYLHKGTLQEEIVYVYMVPSTGFIRLNPEYNDIWVNKNAVLCLDKITFDKPLDYASREGITIV